MNTTARIARLFADAETLEAIAWDFRAQAYGDDKGWAAHKSHALSHAVSCRERAASYIQDAEQAERENG